MKDPANLSAAVRPEVVALDHIYIAVSDFGRSEAFYDGVMGALGFRKGDKAIGGELHAHYFNRALQYTIRPAHSDTPHDPYAPGVHHLCFQVESRAEVDATHRALATLGIAATPPALYPEYNDDYYAIFFADPDGIRLEVMARSRHRRMIVARWEELAAFLNPLAEIARREQGEAQIVPEAADSEDARVLMAALDRELAARYPHGDRRDFDPAEVAEGCGVFLVARIGARAVGCGAVRTIEPSVGEVKRMFVEAASRRRGIARQMLRALEEAARSLGLATIRLETGARQPEAIRLYEREGYGRIPAYGPYAADPMSVCFEKKIGGA